jgi:Family of unknown function (DUF6459)
MLPVTPPPIRARFEYHEADERDAARPLRRATMPCPARTVARIAAALLEVEAGARPGRQLEPLCHPTLWEALVRRLSCGGGPAVTCHSLRRVLIQEHTPGVVDAVAVLQRGARIEPVAMRLDAATGRWQLTELQYVLATRLPDHGEVGA